MAEKNFTERIREYFPRLSPNKQKIATFVVESYHQVAFMTASRLARHLGVDVATVVRFSQDLGYTGYPNMLHEIQDAVKREMQSEYPTSEGTRADIYAKVLVKHKEVLAQTAHQLDPEAIEKALDLVLNARSIYVLGQGMTGDLARLMTSRLGLLGFNAHDSQADIVSTASVLVGLGSEDVMIGLGYSQYEHETANAMKWAKEGGIPTIAIVRSPICPVASAADIALMCPGLDPAELPSFGTLSTLVDAFLQCLVEEKGAAAVTARFKETYVKLGGPEEKKRKG